MPSPNRRERRSRSAVSSAYEASSSRGCDGSEVEVCIAGHQLKSSDVYGAASISRDRICEMPCIRSFGAGVLLPENAYEIANRKTFLIDRKSTRLNSSH